MSNIPIISTTPPPLDLNDSEEEEELDFGAFNGVSPDLEKDIDFVVPEFSQHIVHELDNKSIDNKCSPESDSIGDNRIEDNDSSEQLDSNSNDCINDKNISNCDNSIELQSNTCFNSNDNCVQNIGEDSDENDVKNGVKLENECEDNADIDEELNDFECVVNEEKDSDFADFTSFKFINSDENHNQNTLEDKQSFGCYESQSENSFDDFASNVNNNTNRGQSPTINENHININESDDDFADFASAQPVIDSDFNLNTVSDLKTNSLNSTQIDENDREFADFASFQDNTSHNEFTEFSNFESNISSDQELNKLTQLIAQVFPNSETLSSDENIESISRDLFNSAQQNSKNLWKSLQDLESALSLKLRWPNSHSFQLLLAALNIDPRNILRNPSVPMFASGLGYVLEPTKHKLNSEESLNENEFENINGLSSESIPPVQFDWSSSGLTNPLDVNQKSMVEFDLDFFVTNDDIKTTDRKIAFEELLNQTNESISNETESVVLAPNQSNIVQQILSSVGSTSSISNSKSDATQVLSAEALQVLDELPNLSFMRAKVLMFPINMKTYSNT